MPVPTLHHLGEELGRGYILVHTWGCALVLGRTSIKYRKLKCEILSQKVSTLSIVCGTCIGRYVYE